MMSKNEEKKENISQRGQPPPEPPVKPKWETQDLKPPLPSPTFPKNTKDK